MGARQLLDGGIFRSRCSRPLVQPDLRAPIRDSRAGGAWATLVEFLDAWERVTTHAERIVSAKDKVISVETWRARGKASGIETEVRHSSIWTVTNGKITYFANYGDPDAAFEAAGVSE